MTKSQALQRAINRCWTVIELAERMQVTTMTIYNYRRERGLPAVVIEGKSRPALRFIPSDVRAWARKYKIPLNETERTPAP